MFSLLLSLLLMELELELELELEGEDGLRDGENDPPPPLLFFFRGERGRGDRFIDEDEGFARPSKMEESVTWGGELVAEFSSNVGK